jgi:hypothetical protein
MAELWKAVIESQLGSLAFNTKHDSGATAKVQVLISTGCYGVRSGQKQILLRR